MRGLSALCFIFGVSAFLNAYDGHWAFTQTDRGQTYVYYDIAIGVACWVLSYILFRVWQARQEAALYAAFLWEDRLTEESVNDPDPPAATSAPAVTREEERPTEVHEPRQVAQPPPVTDEWQVCPDCAETVRAAARKCRFCGYRFDGDAS